MSVSSEQIAGLSFRRGAGRKALEIAELLGRNQQSSSQDLLKVFESSEYQPKTLTRLVNGYQDGVRTAISNVEDESFDLQAREEFISQLDNWDVPKQACQVSRNRHEMPYLLNYSAGDKTLGLGPTELILGAFKVMNALSRFYYGDDFLPQVKPAKEYTCLTLSDIKDVWKQAQSVQPTLDQEEITQEKLWRAGMLQCDLKR